jgi:Icc-related predicted phosphoesterase
VRALAFSDLHNDRRQAARLVEQSREVDVVIGAGDFASVHRGLDKTIRALAGIETPALLVPGNNETEDELRAACGEWPAATVLHGEGTAIDDIEFFGLGAGVPVTPWDWSFDLDEEEAAAKLDLAPPGCVLIVHSPPAGHVDSPSGGGHLGSSAILQAIEAKAPQVAVCGHIHEAWGQTSSIGPTAVHNLGPSGKILELG